MRKEKRWYIPVLKNRYFILSIFAFFTVVGKAQNLVPNPSFELADSCSPGQNIFVATGWKSYSGSPDYYNACADSSTGSSVPYNLWGYEPAAEGMAYAGFYSYQSTSTDAREYAGRQLTSPLTVGVKYFVSFKVQPMNTAGANCANSGIGILFSMLSFKECPYPDSASVVRPVPNRATIYSSAIISDTTNWTTISGYFTADSAYQYFEIGTLFADTLIDTMTNVVSNPYPWLIGYYLVDEVIVQDSLTVSTENILSQNVFSVYPNPFNSAATLKIKTRKQNLNGIIKIFNGIGNEVEQIKIEGEETIINRGDLPEGIYYLQITLDNKTYSQKLIISN